MVKLQLQWINSAKKRTFTAKYRFQLDPFDKMFIPSGYSSILKNGISNDMKNFQFFLIKISISVLMFKVQYKCAEFALLIRSDNW